MNENDAGCSGARKIGDRRTASLMNFKWPTWRGEMMTGKTCAHVHELMMRDSYSIRELDDFIGRHIVSGPEGTKASIIIAALANDRERRMDLIDRIRSLPYV